MFTTPAPSAPTLSTTTSSASPTSPSRSTRLRGLSYLRNYTHLHSGQNTRPSAARPRGTHSPPTEPANPTNNNRRDLTQGLLLATSGIAGRSPSTTTTSTATATATRSHSSRPESLQQSSSADSAAQLLADNSGTSNTIRMARHRAETAAAAVGVRSPVAGDAPSNLDGAPNKATLPSIRFIPHNDPRAARPSLTFPAVTRTLPEETAIIRVGRYSERDNIPEVPNNVPSSAPVGFKSKVVSRRHCEFWYSDSRWWIKDVKSSSGTFLNHIRLSQPGVESRPYEVKDGDVVQLGIDFRGGEEMIFRCVKIRIECNRGWQQALNSFNKSTHKRLRNLAKSKSKSDEDGQGSHTSECCICLMPIAPCQSLFVAPCSHVWHYKCIRPILQGPTAPSFLCPNCRAVTDLEADIDDVQDFPASDSETDEMQEPPKKENDHADNADSSSQSGEAAQFTPPNSNTPLSTMRDGGVAQATNGDGTHEVDSELLSSITRININDPPSTTVTGASPIAPPDASSPSPHAVTAPVLIQGSNRSTNSLSPDRAGLGGPDCPMTPRNDVGPFVLDGSASRTSSTRRVGEGSAETTTNS